MAGPAIVIMAAGIGSRYGGFKQIEPVGPTGEIITDYAVYDALKAGFEKVVFVIQENIEKPFREKLGKNIEKRAETAYVFQELLNSLPPGFAPPPGREKPWGTAHAVLCCKDVVDTPFAVINADDFYGADAFGALCGHLKNAGDGGGICDYSMVGYILKNTLSEHGDVSRGVCTVSGDGCLAGIKEIAKVRECGGKVKFLDEGGKWKDISPDSTVSTNTWGFTPGIFAGIEARFVSFLKESAGNIKAEFYLPAVVDQFVKEGRARVRVLPTKERWFGVTYKKDIPAVRRAIRGLIAQGAYPENLWGTA